MHRSLSRAALVALALLVLSLPTPPQAGAGGVGSVAVRAVGDRDPATGDPIPLAGAPFTAYSDAALTTAVGDTVKVMAWYDNEMGYSQRLFDLARFVAGKL